MLRRLYITISMFVIITVPHNCITNQKDDPGCDRNARKFGYIVERAIHRKHVLFISDVRRKQCDMNREGCRNKPMRRDIRAYFGLQTQTVLVDVHTFPCGGFERYPGLMLGIMYQDKQLALARSLVVIIRRNVPGLEVRAFGQGTRANSIINDALVATPPIPALLIEFMEDLSNRIVRAVGRCINIWVTSLRSS